MKRKWYNRVVENKEGGKKGVGSYLQASMVGIHFVSSMVVGLVIGYFLDKYFGTEPWLLIIFFFLGVVAGFIDMFRYAFRPDEPVPSEDTEDGPDGPAV